MTDSVYDKCLVMQMNNTGRNQHRSDSIDVRVKASCRAYSAARCMLHEVAGSAARCMLHEVAGSAARCMLHEVAGSAARCLLHVMRRVHDTICNRV